MWLGFLRVEFTKTSSAKTIEAQESSRREKKWKRCCEAMTKVGENLTKEKKKKERKERKGIKSFFQVRKKKMVVFKV